MKKETYIKIRKNIVEHLPVHTVTFVFSGVGVRRSADSDYPFSANRNFFYATGIEEPGAVLVFDNGKEILFLRDVDETMEKWVGHYMRDHEAKALSGIADVRYFADFDAYLEKVLARKTRIGLDLDQKSFTEEAYGSAISMADYVGIERVIDVQEIFVRARMVKFPEEVEAIKKGIALTHTSIEAMLEEMKPGNNENDMAARFEYETKRNHGSLQFSTILASGPQATVLHYEDNNRPLKDGELVLIDLGSAVNGYGGDISRTYPINGKYTERQKAIYDVVLETMNAVTAAARPGVTLIDLNELAKEKLAQGCKELGIIESSESISDYYYHGIGHSLGLDTHDVWIGRDHKLEPGNVITNEPGLYIAQEGIGIRIETVLHITESGCEDLAPQILRETNEIEAYLSKR